MQNVQPVTLDPGAHTKSARRFLEFYNIKDRNAGSEILREVLTAFSNLPYENLSKIVKLERDYSAPDRIRLPEEVMEDHARHRLGGTCFSLTFFLQSILVSLGFTCYPVIAHMSRMRNSHCALIIVRGTEHWLADPGYLLNEPMRLDKDRSRIYRTPHTGVELRFSQDDEHYEIHTFNQNQLKFRYRFQNVPQSPEQFLDHWLGSFYWPGMRGMCLTRVNADGMVYVHNDYVQVQNLKGKRKGHVTDIYKLVNENFHISPEWVERAREAIPRIIRLGQQHGYYSDTGRE